MDKRGYIYAEIRKEMHGLPQAGGIANYFLTKNIAPHSYYQCRHTPGLWMHKWRPVTYYLVIYDFVLKYVGKKHAEHRITFI